jgi:hypothetical protein
MEDDVDAPYGMDLNGDVDIERDSDDEEEEDKEEEDKKEEDKEEEDKEEEDEEEEDEMEEDEDEDDRKDPWTIGQQEIVNISADDVDTMVDNQAIVRSEQSQEMRYHTPRPQHLGPTPQPHTLKPRP